MIQLNKSKLLEINTLLKKTMPSGGKRENSGRKKKTYPRYKLQKKIPVAIKNQILGSINQQIKIYESNLL